MTVKDIYKFLDEKFPFSLALDWDNSGLLIGDSNATVTKAIVTLDCTKDAVQAAIKCGAELIISHHPVIFSGIKSVTSDSIVHKLIENKISVISAHTNLDIADGGVNTHLCEALGLKNIKTVMTDDGFAFKTGILGAEYSPKEFAEFVSRRLSVPVRYTAGKKFVKTVAVCGGSGGDLLGAAAKCADVLVTADIKHNFFIEADTLGFTIIDGGHFNTEDVVIEPLKNILSKQFNDIEFITNHTNVIMTVVNQNS